MTEPNVSVDVDAVHRYATTTSSMARELETAGAGTAAAGPALLGPAFGLIGGDFVAAFAQAHSSHVSRIDGLAAVLHAMSAAATASADGYVGTDAESAGSLRSVVIA